MIKHVMPLLLLIGLSYSQGGSYALDFDGSNDYVEVSGYTGVTGTSSRTVELWVKTSAYGMISYWGTNSCGWRFGLRVNSNSDYGTLGALKVEIGCGYKSGTTDLTDGNWHHLAVAFATGGSADDFILYVDGIQESTSSLDRVFNTQSSSNVKIGYWDEYFNGQFDEIRIWDDVRTAAEIRANMHAELSGSESNLVAYYQMSNGSGTSLTDNSSNSNTGTLTNMVTSGGSSDWVTSYAPIGDLNSSYVTDIEAIWSASGTSASDASDGLTMTVSSALSTGNFAVFGNNNTSGTSASDLGSVGSSIRTGRIWQVDESGTVAGTVTIDISDATGNAGQSGTASNFRLLYRSGTSGDFSSAATGASISGDAVSFTSVSLADGYYALGAESDATLPVELTTFEVLDTRDNGITLHWITESEINNLGFILDRRTPTINWIEIASFVTDTELQGQGSVSHQTVYTYTDNTVTDDETYDYRIADVDYDGNKEYHSLQLMGISPASIPITYVLHQNYPNPFNPITTLSYDLPEDALVNITIYDMMGKVVRTLINMEQTVGYRSVQWNGTNDNGSPVSAGLYLYTIQAGEFVQTKKMVMLK
jgi:hypothetical protein